MKQIVATSHTPPIYAIVDGYDGLTKTWNIPDGDPTRRKAHLDAASEDAFRASFFRSFFKSFKSGLSDGTVGRLFMAGTFPISLDDFSSGFNVGTDISRQSGIMNLASFTRSQVEIYVDQVLREHGIPSEFNETVKGDLERHFGGYCFAPDAEPLLNPAFCNSYLKELVETGKIPSRVVDPKSLSEEGWLRRLVQANCNSPGQRRSYIERSMSGFVGIRELSAKFGRAKFFSEEFFPYALYYLGLLTFRDQFQFDIPNLTIKNMFADYCEELSEFKNVGVTHRTGCGMAARATW